MTFLNFLLSGRSDRIRPEEVTWPSGEGREVGTIRCSMADLLDALNRGSPRQAFSYGEDGTERAVILGPPSRPLASLVADETQAPGIVAVIADVGADPATVIGAVERALGPGFQVRRHAA